MSWRATLGRNRTYHVTILSVREDSAPSPRRTDRSSKPAETSKACPCHQVPRVKATDRAEAADVLFQRRVSLARSVRIIPASERNDRASPHTPDCGFRTPSSNSQTTSSLIQYSTSEPAMQHHQRLSPLAESRLAHSLTMAADPTPRHAPTSPPSFRAARKSAKPPTYRVRRVKIFGLP